MTQRLLLLTLFFFLLPTTSFAATEGRLGATSTASAKISVVIPQWLRISNVDDVDLGSFQGSGDMRGSDSVCVYTNGRAGTYRVVARGNGSGGAFTLQDEASNSLAYDVSWRAGSGGNGSALSAGGKSKVFQGAHTSSKNCEGKTNAGFLVNVKEDVLKSSSPGTYRGTLSLMVEPD